MISGQNVRYLLTNMAEQHCLAMHRREVLPAICPCGSTYRWKFGFTKPNHCLITPSMSLPRSATSLRTNDIKLVSYTYQADDLVMYCLQLFYWYRRWIILLRDKQVSPSAWQKIWWESVTIQSSVSSKPKSKLTFISNNSRTRGSYNAKIPSKMSTWGE